ncbi:MAG TPA: single-stranded DNA-binding protein [Methanocella sp.]|nr:single-stranded DNA-binding protein [Methanocella sp.]
MDDTIAPIADELNRALGIDRDTLERELTLLIVEYKVPPEEARRSLLKKHRHAFIASQPKEAEAAEPPEGQRPAPAVEQARLLKDVRVGDAGITVIASVVGPEYREISTPRGVTPAISGMLEDATARLHFTAWVDVPDIFTTKAIVARDVYVKSFHGMPSININEKTVLEEYPGTVGPYVRTPQTLGELAQTDGAYDVETEGDVLSLRPGSGVVERCPQCSRVMQKGQCRAHGRLEGVRDLRIKAVLDDGTGSIICVLDRPLTEKIAGATLEDLAADPDRADATIRAAIVGTPLRVRGNLTRGDFGMILVATDVDRPSDDAFARARTLMGEIR